MKEFKLIIAGGRDFNDYNLLEKAVFELVETDLQSYSVSLVSGMANGADALGYQFARKHKAKVYPFPANWNKYGKGAGYRRNEEMGNFSDGLIAFWDHKSRGTHHMIQFMQSQKKPVWVIPYTRVFVQRPLKPVQWARRHPGGYEVSSRGDNRFSALYALLSDGRTIEQHYQCDVKGYDPGGTNWKLGKGKPPLDTSKDLWKEYLALWRAWATESPHLINELVRKMPEHDWTLTDMFANTDVNQARALATILNEP